MVVPAIAWTTATGEGCTKRPKSLLTWCAISCYEHYMPFVRKKRGQVIVAHNNRTPEGKVRQEILYAFGSPAELEEVLTKSWSDFRKSMEWRHGQYRWRWEWLRSNLEECCKSWVEEPTGAAVRRESKIVRLAEQLTTTLSDLTPARPGDAVVFEAVKPAITDLQGALGRVLESGPSRAGMGKRDNRAAGPDSDDEADGLFDEGMEYWWGGDRTTACRLFRKAVKLDPCHSEANNHLGIERMERGQLGAAERHFLAAIEGGERNVVREVGQVRWGFLENRPFLRALGNLALLRRRQERYREAVEIWERLLFLNPNDNQGIRWLLGEGYHRLGDFDQAIKAYEKGLEEPGCRYSLALALHETKQDHKVGLALLRAFEANRYIAPMLLGEKWKALKGFHGTNMAEPEWAADYVQQQGDLWRRVPSSAELLLRWWQAEPVRNWIAELDETVVQLGRRGPGEERGEVLGRQRGLVAESTLRKIASEVEPKSLPFLPKRAHVASPDEVKITRDGDSVLIEYADDSIISTRLVLGPEVEQMTDAEILDHHNEILIGQQQLRDDYEHEAVEVPPGRPQIEYDVLSQTWVPRGDVLRCVIEDGVGEEGPTLFIDDHGLTLKEFGKLLETYAGWGMRLTFVPDDELDEEPCIRKQDPTVEKT